MRKKVSLVVGGSGFVGQHLLRALLHKKGKVAGTYFQRSRAALNIPGAAFYPCNAANEKQVEWLIKKLRPDEIYYLSGQSSTRKSWNDPLHTVRVNLLGGLHVCEAARKYAPRTKILLTSSAMVYGDSFLEGKPVNETAPLLPRDPYGISKTALDAFARRYAKVLGLHTVGVRPSNMTGPGQSIEFSLCHFAYQIAGMEAGQLKREMKVGNLKARRDFLDVRDACEGMIGALRKGKKGEVYNLSSGKTRCLEDCFNQLFRLSTISRGSVRIKRQARYIAKDEITVMRLSSAKLRAQTGWKPKMRIEKTLLDILHDQRKYWKRA